MRNFGPFLHLFCLSLVWFSTVKDKWDFMRLYCNSGWKGLRKSLVQPLAPSSVSYKITRYGPGIYPVLKISINTDYSASLGNLCRCTSVEHEEASPCIQPKNNVTFHSTFCLSFLKNFFFRTRFAFQFYFIV